MEASTIRHIVNYSMGVCSAYIAAQWQRDGKEPLCQFNDTRREDPDTYRFGREVAERFGLNVVDASDGRDLWDVFRGWKMIPARQISACSREMKIKPSEAWLKARDAEGIPGWVAFGYDVNEYDRAEETLSHWKLTNLRPCFPLQEWGVTKQQCFGFFAEQGIAVPRIYQWRNNANCAACKNFREADWLACLHYTPEVFADAQELEDVDGLKWMQDGPYLREVREKYEKAGAAICKARRPLRDGLAAPAFSFDIGCGRCTVD